VVNTDTHHSKSKKIKSVVHKSEPWFAVSVNCPILFLFVFLEPVIESRSGNFLSFTKPVLGYPTLLP